MYSKRLGRTTTRAVSAGVAIFTALALAACSSNGGSSNSQTSDAPTSSDSSSSDVASPTDSASPTEEASPTGEASPTDEASPTEDATTPTTKSLFPTLSSPPSGPSAELIAAAKQESGKLTTYLSFTDTQIQKVFDEFEKAYPFVTDAENVSVSGADTSARLVQEGLAGGPTADYGETPANYLADALSRDLLTKLDPAELGLPPEMLDNDYMVPVSTNTWGLIINTTLVSEADRPKTWDDLLAPKWSGKITMWSNAASIGNLAPVWGEEKTLKYATEFMAHEPTLVASSAAVVQALTAGESPVGITSYAQATAAKDAGQPVAWYALDPVSVSVSEAYIPTAASNPNTGKLFLSWFAAQGYPVKEAATNRGVPNLPGETQDLLKGLTIAGWTAAQSEDKAAIEKKISALFPRG